MSADFERVRDQMNVFNVGISWLLKDHNSKITSDYENKPMFNTTSSGDIARTFIRSQFVLQYHVAFRVCFASRIPAYSAQVTPGDLRRPQGARAGCNIMQSGWPGKSGLTDIQILPKLGGLKPPYPPYPLYLLTRHVPTYPVFQFLLLSGRLFR